MSDVVFTPMPRAPRCCALCGQNKRDHVRTLGGLGCPDAFPSVQRGKATPRHRAPSRSERASLARRARVSGALVGISLATVGVKPVSTTSARRVAVGRLK